MLNCQRLTALDGKRRFALAAAASHKEEVGRLRSVSSTQVHCVIGHCKSKFSVAINPPVVFLFDLVWVLFYPF